MLKNSNYRLLAVLIAAFVVVASIYSIIVPIFEASDEVSHYPMVRTLAQGNGLPVQDPANHGPWKQEGSQPPLYYAVGAAATFWIDTADMDAARRLNPHVDSGKITPDGNINLIVHNTAAEAWPWRGTALAVHIVRFLSVLMSAGTIYFTYRIGEEVFPERRWLALAGAAVAAFTPMFVFISGSINNDNLAALIASAGIWVMLRILRAAHNNQPTVRLAAVLGVLIGLGALTKQSTLGLLALAGLTMAYAAWRQKRWQTFFIEGPLIVGLALAIAGWWYLRNWRLYGDPLGLNVFVAIAGPRSASLAQLWGERTGFVWSYWGFFGGVNVPMGAWIYPVLNIIALLSAVGIVVLLVRKAQPGGWTLDRWAAAILTLLWIPGVFIPLLRWSSMTMASQGRLMFSAISVLSLWLAAGLGGWLPERWGKITAFSFVGLLAVLTIIAPFVWIAPAYALPAQVDEPSGEARAEFAPPGSDEPAMRLLSAEVNASEVLPGGSVEVVLTWEVAAPMDRRWSRFVHLQNSVELLSGQRDTYPGGGLLATDDLEPGRRWTERVIVPVTESAYVPETIDVRVGLYDLQTGERMSLVGSDETSAIISTLPLRSRGGDVPNPISYNYGGQMELTGYEMDTRRVQPGDEIAVTLYWRALRDMETNYSVSVQLAGRDGPARGHMAGQKDAWPVDGAYPTSVWAEGEVIEDPYTVAIAEDAPPGIYDVEIVVYELEDSGEITKLKRVVRNGQLVDERILLSPIWVTP